MEYRSRKTLVQAHGNRRVIWIDLASFCQLNRKPTQIHVHSTSPHFQKISLLNYDSSNVYQAVSLMSQTITFQQHPKNPHEYRINTSIHCQVTCCKWHGNQRDSLVNKVQFVPPAHLRSRSFHGPRGKSLIGYMNRHPCCSRDNKDDVTMFINVRDHYVKGTRNITNQEAALLI